MPKQACNNACAVAGASQCSATQLQTCTADANGCLSWSAPTSCGSQKYCSGSACVACSTSSACATSGATQCAGTQVQTCAADANGCLGWSAPAACAANLTCNATQNKCVDHLIALSWAPNRESGVNSAGGGYEVSISGQPTMNIPFVSGPTAPTSATARLPPGTYTVTARAYARLDAQGGSTGSLSAASQSLTFTVP